MGINTADITDTTDILTRGMHNSVYNPSDVWLVLLYLPFHLGYVYTISHKMQNKYLNAERG